jgi:hypothetical protein
MVFKEMTPSQAEMMYSYCKSDSAVSDRVHYVKSKATLYNKTFRWLEVFILPKSSLGIKDDFLSECFRTGAGISCFIGNLSIVVGYGLWIMGLLSLLTICLLILLKFAIDAVLIHKSHSFLTTTKMQYLILSSLFYPFLVWVLLCTLIGKYEWKVDAFRSLITVVEENPTS